MEVYVNEMLVKSERVADDIAHLVEMFQILRKDKMKHNP